jgi:cutinase
MRSTVSKRVRPLAASLVVLALAGAGATSCTRWGGGRPTPTTGAPTTAPPTTGDPGTPTPTTAPPANNPGCPGVEIVTARGTGESQNAAMGLSGLNQGIVSQVPGTTIYQVVYPATADFLGSAATGTKDALAHLKSKAAQCPGTRFFLTGYSQGGMVQTGVLQQLPADLDAKVIGGVLYGNPYYKGNSATAAGPDKSAQGIIPGGIPAKWGGKVHDYCVQGDSVCGSGAAPGSIGLTRGITPQHLTYPRSALEREAIAWAVGVIKGS